MQDLFFTAIAIAIMVHGIALPFEDGEIFETAGSWLEDKAPGLHKAIIGCPACMAFWWALPIAGFLIDSHGLEYALVPFIALGINVIIIKNRPKETVVELLPPAGDR